MSFMMGQWKEHPLKIQKHNWKITSIPLRISMKKNEWSKAKETGFFKKAIITRNFGKQWRSKGHLANEVIIHPDQEGMFMIEPKLLKSWRKANSYSMGNNRQDSGMNLEQNISQD